MLKTGIVNIGLRGITQASKFVLLLFIASRLAPADLGVYGLVSVTIAISLYLVGMDFYAFNTREILAREERHRAPLIRNQAVFHGLAYVIALPLLLSVFIGGLISWKYAGWFYVLLIIEHLSQESGRLLITLGRPTTASWILLLRSGIWVYVVLAWAQISGSAPSLRLIWCLWCFGGLASLGLAFFSLRTLDWKASSEVGVDWTWLKKGVFGSLPFFGSTVALLGIQYADRYFLRYFHGETQLGVYTFFANIANMIQVFVFTGIIMILYPKIVEAFQMDKSKYSLLMRKMSLGIVGGVVVLSGAATLCIRLALHVVGKDIYSEHLDIFWIMLVSVALMTLSYIPHYGLYVRKKDRSIIASTGIALAGGLVANAVLVPGHGVRGAAWATLLAMVVLVTLKSLCLLIALRTDREAPRFERADVPDIPVPMPSEESEPMLS